MENEEIETKLKIMEALILTATFLFVLIGAINGQSFFQNNFGFSINPLALTFPIFFLTAIGYYFFISNKLLKGLWLDLFHYLAFFVALTFSSIFTFLITETTITNIIYIKIYVAIFYLALLTTVIFLSIIDRKTTKYYLRFIIKFLTRHRIKIRNKV